MKRRIRARRDMITVCIALALAVFFAIFLMIAAYDNKKTGIYDKNPGIPAVNRVMQKFHAKDGDSLISPEGKHIRLLCIDAPELKQRHGVRAGKFLAELVKDGAHIRSRGKDQYGRTLAVVIVAVGDKELIANHEMLRYGHAWVYRRFSDDCGLPEKPMIAMEEEARAASRGLWQNKNPVPPWKWRQKR